MNMAAMQLAPLLWKRINLPRPTPTFYSFYTVTSLGAEKQFVFGLFFIGSCSSCFRKRRERRGSMRGGGGGTVL
jgi:hypothetical protein